MKAIVVMLLFPYFLPLVAISAIALAYLLVTPDDLTVTGPTEGDVLGAYFMMLCVFVGAVVQVVIGIPYCLLLNSMSSKIARLLFSLVAIGIAVFPFFYIFAQMPPPPKLYEMTVTMTVIISCFAAGIWICLHTFHPDLPVQNKPAHTTAGNAPV